MNTKEAKREIKQLKSQLRAARQKSALRLFTLMFVLAALAVAAGVMYGKIQLPQLW